MKYGKSDGTYFIFVPTSNYGERDGGGQKKFSFVIKAKCVAEISSNLFVFRAQA